MRIGHLGLIAALGLIGCSSSQPDVEAGPRPEARSIPGAGAGGTESVVKNENVPEHASTAARFGIPPGHLPAPGQCRVWLPGEPPGQQKKRYPSGDCAIVATQVPAGGWLVYRPGEGKKEVEVREYGVGREVTVIRVFDLVTGALLRESHPRKGS